MASGDPDHHKVMQCHSTPDSAPRVCVGFAVRVGSDSVGYRLAGAMGLIDEVEADPDDLLEDVEQVIHRHNTGRGLRCR
jgi:hypothetical protein